MGKELSNPGFNDRFTCPECYTDFNGKKTECPSCKTAIVCTVETQPVAICRTAEGEDDEA